MEYNQHISANFNRELDNLSNAVLIMGGEIEIQLQQTLLALKHSDAKLAEKVIVNDLTVNSMEMEIDQECLRLLATRNPAASDLRLVMTIAKCIIDIERIGDEIERVAQLVTRYPECIDAEVKAAAYALGNMINDMLHQSLNAFARRDIKEAIQVYELDEEIDEQYETTLLLVKHKMRTHSELIDEALEVVFALRSFERIGDRCKNICEYILYLGDHHQMQNIQNRKLQKRVTGLIKNK